MYFIEGFYEGIDEINNYNFEMEKLNAKYKYISDNGKYYSREDLYVLDLNTSRVKTVSITSGIKDKSKLTLKKIFSIIYNKKYISIIHYIQS